MLKVDFDELLKSLRERGSELDDIEVKDATGGTPTRLWQSFSALANRSGGGTLILGLSPDLFQPTGLKHLDALQRDIGNVCAEMEPPIRPAFDTFTVERGKRVLVVSIPECARHHKPCFYMPKGLPAGAFIRVGDSDRVMTDYEVQSHIAARGQPEEDIRPPARVEWDALDQERIKKFFAALRERRPHAKHLSRSEEDLSQTYKIATQRGLESAVAPSLAGLLMFGKYPQGELPNLCITVVRYSGNTMEGSRDASQIIENQKIEGTIPDMLEGALDVIRRNMQRRTLKTGLMSEEITEYPELAVREVLVNAVGHRDYGPGALGSQVQVKMFSDGLVVQSPGGLFGPVTEETLGEAGVQASRNVYLMRMLEEIGVAENRGSGIRTVSAQLAKAHLPPPEFEDGRTYFRVTFSNESLLDEGTVTWLNQFAGFPLNDGQRLALALVRKHHTIRNLDYSRLNQCDSRMATADLAGLRELGLINQLGSRRWAVYELAPAFTEAMLPPKVADWKARHRMVFGFIQKEGTVSIKQIVEGCKLSTPYARVTVRELLKMGVLEGTEKNKHSPKQSYRIKKRAA